MVNLFLYFAVGAIAGILGGMLGIGGGVILMPFLRFFVGLEPTSAAGTVITAVFFTAIGGSIRHYKMGNIKIKKILPIVVSGAVMTIIASFLFPHFSGRGKYLDLGIGVVFLLVSSRMLLEAIFKNSLSKIVRENSELKGSLSKKILIGGIAGTFPGLLGIGTGAILVPSLVFMMNVPTKIAMSSSLACFSLNALISSSFKVSQDFVNLAIVIPLSIGTFAGANIGAIINKKFSSKTLKAIFGILFTYVAFKFILSFFGVKI